MDFDKILDKILARLNEYQVKGAFKFDIDNLDNVYKVDEIIEEVLKEEGYYKNLKEYKKLFDENLTEVIAQYKSFGAVSTPDLKAFNNLAFDNFYTNLAGSITDSSIKVPIKDALLQYIAGGGRYKDFKDTVKEILTTKKIEGNIDTIAREYAFQYRRAQGQIIATKLNIKYFLYFGTEIETTRCFCQERIGNIYTKEEVESWADLDWNGKEKGTNKGNIAQKLGGWRCRHDLMAVSEARALREGVNKYNEVDCEL